MLLHEAIPSLQAYLFMNRELQILLVLPKVVIKEQQCTTSIGIILQV